MIFLIILCTLINIFRMKNVFCKSLTNAISFKIQGSSNDVTFNPCCVYKEHIPFNKLNFYKAKINFSKIQNFNNACLGCYYDERTNKESLRIVSNKTIPDNLNIFDIHKLEIVLDTTCNAACIQCGYLQSSLWRKELGFDNFIQDKHDIDIAIKKILEIVKIEKVKEFFFWGGEPLITDTHLKILRQVKDYNDVNLMYTTNGSACPDNETISIWKQCKSVRINISIDGVEDKFHYMRWPLNWKKINQTLESLENYNLDNLKCKINFCLTPITSFYLEDLINWKEKCNLKLFPKENYIKFIKVNGNLDLEYTPLLLRHKLIDMYGENHIMNKFLSMCDTKHYSPMVEYLDKWDQKRNLNWRETFKEVSDYFK